MILLFPDVETVRLALTSGLVPADITLAPAAVSTDPQGRVYVEPKGTVPRPVAKTLDKLGVKGSKRHGADEVREVGSWVEVLPLAKASGPPTVGSQTPVLFELDSASDLPSFVTEMLRLGNDRQGFRAFAGPTPDADGRVLLRVLGPPYYTLLRALDPAAAGVRAYLERAPRVWVQAGHDHPLAAQVKVPDGQLALVRPPADWLFLDDAPFRDVYDVLRFELPAPPVRWAEAGPPDKLAVPLKLAAGNAADVPEFWVLRGDAVPRLDALVRDADDRLVERLTFAVAAGADDARTVVLRTRPSKLAPPALPLDDALGFKPFWKLPNLFVPAGTRLHPTLRRDAVRNLLAPDPDQVVWLDPDGRGGFVPRSLPDAAFRPLVNWVDYVIEADQAPLAAWIGSTRFDFDHFVCKDGNSPKPAGDKPEAAPKDRADAGRKADRVAAAKKPATKPAAPAQATPTPAAPLAVENRPRDEWAERRAMLEAKFLDVDGPLDDPARQALWPELAAANAGVGDAAEAALCWLNALWGEADPPREWVQAWARSEGVAGPVTAAEFDARLARPHPSLQDARVVVALFLRLAGERPPPAWLAAKLPAVQAYVTAHQAGLPVRAVWLAAVRLSQLAGSDELGLARTRDRLLLRLLQEGLSPERDLPSFLRFAGRNDGERLRAVRDKVLDLHRAARAWVAGVPPTGGYVDLLFAYALAKIGESGPATALADQAGRELASTGPGRWDDYNRYDAAAANLKREDYKQYDALYRTMVGDFLYRGFRARFDAALRGRPTTGALPAELLTAGDALSAKVAEAKRAKAAATASQVQSPFERAVYVIARMREESDILEPDEARDPYAMYTAEQDPFKKHLLQISSLRDPAALADQSRRLFRLGYKDRPLPQVRFDLLLEVMLLAPRAGEAFAAELLAAVPAALAAGPSTDPAAKVATVDASTAKRGELLSRAMLVAAHFGRSDTVQMLVDEFFKLLRAGGEADRLRLVSAVAGPSLRSLRKLGMRDQIDRLLTLIRSDILRGGSLADLKQRYAGGPVGWGDVLRALLNLAAGWLSFGLDDRATPILDAARAEVLTSFRAPTAPAVPRADVPLARAYVAAAGQARSGAGLDRIAELFRTADPAAIVNNWTGSVCFSRLHLLVVEEVVTTLVDADAGLGSAARRWLDDDEFLVRRRVHADMDAARHH